ncbi:hypothetical protein [Bradyrhizobium sp. P5_C11_2]
MILKSIIVGSLALPLALAASQAFAGPCSQDVALLVKQMQQMGVDPAAMASANNDGGGANTGMMPPGVSAAKGVTTLPAKSAAGQATGPSAGNQKVDPAAIAALDDARKADLQGDAQKCKSAVETVRKHLKS